MTTLARQPEADRAELGSEQTDGAAASGCACTHCGLPVPLGLIEAGRDEQFCCAGCASVYEVIHGCGLDAYYRLRDQADAPRQPANTSFADRLSVFDSEKFAELYVTTRDDGLCAVDLMLENVHCAACVWLIEKLPRVVGGVVDARLSLRESTVRVVWDPQTTELSSVARALGTLGYPPHPARSGTQSVQLNEQRTMLIRLGIAGALAGNTMLLAFALYAGLFGGMERQFSELFRWASAVLGVLSLTWPGRVFFQGAWAALRTRTPHLDVPIALALGVGGLAGVVNVVLGRGEIYFDSLTVLVFLLLVGRFIQYRQQRRADASVGLLFSLTPSNCRRVMPVREGAAAAETIEQVPIEAAEVGDVLEVRAGELIPADGVVTSGRAMVAASLLTGESQPVAVQAGDRVCAGSQVSSSTLRLRVSAVGEETRVGRLMELVQQGVADKPTIVALTDRIAGWFVVVVSSLALMVFAGWSVFDLGAAVDHTVALLIIACPCALGLATPLTLAVAIGRAARRDILIKSGAVLDRLAKPGRLLIDKTGTMTRGAMRVESWFGDPAMRSWVVAAESEATHPIARAIASWGESEGISPASRSQLGEVVTHASGVEATTPAGLMRIGSKPFILSSGCVIEQRFSQQAEQWAERACTTVYVAFDDRVVASLAVGDALHPETRASLERLSSWGWEVTMLTGDEPTVAHRVAEAVGLDRSAVRAGVTPEQKLAAASDRYDQRAIVMVGDGVNDAAALASADVGVSVSGGAEASMAAADVYLARPGLSGLVELIGDARRSRGVIYQNLGVSLSYNAVAIGLAAAGLVTPLVAAILMPLSSAAVLGLAMKGQCLPGWGLMKRIEKQRKAS